MEINWFTVIAQVINFLILVWLLKRFLYKPVLDAIEQREKKIAAQLNDAESKKAEAQQERNEFQQKNETLDKLHATRLEEVEQEVRKEKEKLFAAIKEESNALRIKYETSLKQEEESITQNLKRRASEEVFAIAGKTLNDLASEDLGERLVKVLIRQIQQLNGQERTTCKDAFSTPNDAVIVKSAVELSYTSKDELQKAIRDLTESKTNFEYQVAPGLISGIEIDSKSYKLSWNIDSYLEGFQKAILTSMQSNHKEKQHAIE